MDNYMGLGFQGSGLQYIYIYILNKDICLLITIFFTIYI